VEPVVCHFSVSLGWLYLEHNRETPALSLDWQQSYSEWPWKLSGDDDSAHTSDLSGEWNCEEVEKIA
jgi:hypothetical protein